MDNKELTGLFLLFSGAATLVVAFLNAFLAGFGFISEKSIIPLCVVSVLVFFSGVILLLIPKKGA
jgi:hypothetical protein